MVADNGSMHHEIAGERAEEVRGIGGNKSHFFQQNGQTPTLASDKNLEFKTTFKRNVSERKTMFKTTPH